MKASYHSQKDGTKKKNKKQKKTTISNPEIPKPQTRCEVGIFMLAKRILSNCFGNLSLGYKEHP